MKGKQVTISLTKKTTKNLNVASRDAEISLDEIRSLIKDSTPQNPNKSTLSNESLDDFVQLEDDMMPKKSHSPGSLSNFKGQSASPIRKNAYN